MELSDLASADATFAALSHRDKIRAFAWFLHTQRARETFAQRDVERCYDELHLDRPASLGPYIATMARSKPPQLLKTRDGWKLEHRAREEAHARYGVRPLSAHIDGLLSTLPARLPDLAERQFLEETILCFRAGAFRATVVMCWNLVFDHLCAVVLRQHLASFNAALAVAFPKERPIQKRDDFADLKESQVLQVCRTANITSANIDKVLREKLTKRNLAAHPSAVTMNRVTAEEFVSDAIENALLRL